MEVMKELHHIAKVDVIGDIHGCYDELVALLLALGYEERGEQGLYSHSKDDGRVFAFVGDLTDRGPKNREVVEFAHKHALAGLCYVARGNHDDKLSRALKGNPVSAGGNLQKTLDQLQGMPSEQLQDIADWLDTLPYGLSFDQGRLLVCHAAPPGDTQQAEKKQKQIMLYGHVTGKKTPEGFPERLDWVPDYESKAKGGADLPYVIYGHITHEDAYVTAHTCCVDTACFAGNKLTAMSWPDRTLTAVPSAQPGNEGDLRLANGGYSDAPKLLRSGITPSPIIDVSLPYLMSRLRLGGEEILYLIDTDEMLTKRSLPNGLTIANASKALVNPEYEHQLYAKGVVYRAAPYKLVSLPLTKMYNYGMTPISDKALEAMSQRSGVVFQYPEKYDGTMVQLFEYGGQTYFTTRSVLEGTMGGDDDKGGDTISFIQESRRIALQKYPALLDPKVLQGRSLVFELIHPQNRIVTDYHGREALVLLAVFDTIALKYWGIQDVVDFAQYHGLDTYEKVYRFRDFHHGLKIAAESLAPRAGDVPEGHVVWLEDPETHEVLHRVKVKLPEYLRLHRLKYQCTYKVVAQMLWDMPEIRTWEAFKEHLSGGGDEEEVGHFYREYFEQYMRWEDECAGVHHAVSQMIAQYGDKSSGAYCGEGCEREYFKALAAYAKANYAELFTIIMAWARRGGLTVREVQQMMPPFKGFKF